MSKLNFRSTIWRKITKLICQLINQSIRKTKWCSSVQIYMFKVSQITWYSPPNHYLLRVSGIVLKQSFRESFFLKKKLYSTNFEDVIICRSMKESFLLLCCLYRPYPTRICLCKFNLLIFEKKVFWRYYAVDFELVNEHRVGIKYVCTCSSSV